MNILRKIKSILIKEKIVYQSVPIYVIAGSRKEFDYWFKGMNGYIYVDDENDLLGLNPLITTLLLVGQWSNHNKQLQLLQFARIRGFKIFQQPYER